MNFPNSADARKAAIPALVLVGTSLLLFAPALFADRAFYLRDVLNYYWPMRAGIAAIIGNGEFPQWNPLPQSGLPLLGDAHAAALYPFNLLYQVLSFPRAYAWLLAVHHIAVACGLYVFLRNCRLARASALCGALAFMLSGYVAGTTTTSPLMFGAAYVTWALAVVTSARSVWLRAALLAVLIALQTLSGDPHSVLFSVFALAAVLALRPSRSDFAVVTLGFLIAGALAAIQLIPAWNVMREATRSTAGAEYMLQLSLHPSRLIELFSPYPFGKILGTPEYWPEHTIVGPGRRPFVHNAYLGMSAAVVIALGARRSKLSGSALTLVVVGTILALGMFFLPARVFLSLPPFSYFRYPEEYLLLTSLGVALAVADSLESLIATRPSSRRIIAVVTAFVGLTLAALATFIWDDLARGLLAFLTAPQKPMPEQAAEAWHLAIQHSVLLGVAALLLVLFLRNDRPQYGAVVAALVALDLASIAVQVVFTAPMALYETRPPLVDAVNAAAPMRPFRFDRSSEIIGQHSNHDEEASLNEYGYEIATLVSNTPNVFGVEEHGGYGGGYSLRRWMSLAWAVRHDTRLRLSLMNACVSLVAAGNPLYANAPFEKVVVADGEELGVDLFVNRDCLPRLRSIPHVESMPTINSALWRVAQRDFDIHRTATTESGPTRDFGPLTLTNETFGTTWAQADVDVADRAAFLGFTTSYFPGWNAYVDGRRATVEIINVATMGVEVPPGARHVRFEFVHPGLHTGAILSVLGALLVATCLVMDRQSRRRSNDVGVTA